jgi:hypothetical protein
MHAVYRKKADRAYGRDDELDNLAHGRTKS